MLLDGQVARSGEALVEDQLNPQQSDQHDALLGSAINFHLIERAILSVTSNKHIKGMVSIISNIKSSLMYNLPEDEAISKLL